MANTSRYRWSSPLKAVALSKASGNMNCSQMLTGKLSILLWLGVLAVATAQPTSPEQGRPLIRHFFPEEYRSDITCTSLLQDNRGLIYVANQLGVLEYDGAEWRLIPVPIGHSVRALAQSSDGVIYTGGVKNLGFLEPDEKGRLAFRSIADQLPEGQRDFGFFREALAVGDTIYLRGEKLLVQVAGKRILHTWPVNGWRGLFYVNGRIYVDQLHPGLSVLEGGQLKLVPGGEQFANTHVYLMLPLDDGILLGTMNRGLFWYRPEKEGAEAFQPFHTEADAYFLEHQCYSGHILPNGHIAIGTFTGGLAIIDKQGQLLETYHEFSGFTIRVIEDMMTDRQGALWFTSENGISRVEFHLPLTYWGKEMGLSSLLASITRFSGQLFIAGHNDLLLFDPQGHPEKPFQHFANLGRTINPVSLLATPPIDGKARLMIGGSSGLAEASRTADGQWQIQVIDTLQNSEYLYHFPQYPRRLFILNRINNEIRAIKLEKGVWREEERKFIDEPTFMSSEKEGQLWVGTFHRGFARLPVGPEGQLLESPPVYYGMKQGLPSENFAAPLSLQGQLFFQVAGAAFRFDAALGRFVPARELTDWMEKQNVQYLQTDNQGNLILLQVRDNQFHIKGFAFLEQPGQPMEKAYQIDTVFRKRLPLALTSIYTDDNGIFWLGTNQGLYRYDRRERSDTHYPLTIYIRKVLTGQDSLLFNGALTPGQSPEDGFQLPQPLAYQLNSVSFRFVAQGYDDAAKNLYRYYLEGFDESWSPWLASHKKEYTNLPEGEYTFRVMARDIYDNISPEARFCFTIAPPWWRTILAYIALGILLSLTLWVMMWYRTRLDRQKLARQQVKLEKERQLNERLRQVDRLKDQFLANTSHELRTPLHGIIGLAESLEAREVDPDKLEDIQMITSSGKRLSSLVNDILDFSRLRNHEIELQPKPVDMHALVDVILRIHTPLARGKDLKLENKIPLRGSIVYGDENRLMQVMHNLVGNSIKFTEAGHVRVEARREPGFLKVSVEDTGIGIPQAKREAIFQEFEQADGSEKRIFTGSGLGLSVSKRLIEMHGGQLWVESEEGKGATFSFTLPLSREKVAPDMAPPEPASRPEYTPGTREIVQPLQLPPTLIHDEGNEKVRILVVDDEPINQRVLRNHFRDEHFQIIPAMNGSEALQAIALAEEPFDLILLDVMMPRMSGYEVCQKIRERYLPSELPIIMVTAKNQVSDLVEGLAVGANDYLAKPFTKEEFLARIKTHLYLHRINAATGKFVPYEFLQALGREAITEVRLGDQALREVTVFFADIRGYTSLAETMSPSDNFRFVNALNGRLGPHIRSNQGFINQYLGDAIMAIFPREPIDALNAAILMQETLHEYNRYRQKKKRRPIRLGMGIHSGSLIMGIIGDHKRMDAATISDTVNTASRVESLTKYYGVNILLTEESLQRIPNQEDCLLRYLGKVQVIGKKKALGLYECFNGDEPWQRKQKLESLSEFREAVDDYFRQDFWDAGHAFEDLLQRYPEDGAVRFFLGEARRLASEGAPEGWTGVVEMKMK
ncbi:MAG: response regulator [Phaeodactylibacter sp.]|nr:response regulator [Phaeodactylibacter sp.]